MSEEEFFGSLVEQTKCGVLLDITNINVNSTNFCADARVTMDRMPLDRVVQVTSRGRLLG